MLNEDLVTSNQWLFRDITILDSLFNSDVFLNKEQFEIYQNRIHSIEKTNKQNTYTDRLHRCKHMNRSHSYTKTNEKTIETRIQEYMNKVFELVEILDSNESSLLRIQIFIVLMKKETVNGKLISKEDVVNKFRYNETSKRFFSRIQVYIENLEFLTNLMYHKIKVKDKEEKEAEVPSITYAVTAQPQLLNVIKNQDDDSNSKIAEDMSCIQFYNKQIKYRAKNKTEYNTNEDDSEDDVPMFANQNAFGGGGDDSNKEFKFDRQMFKTNLSYIKLEVEQCGHRIQQHDFLYKNKVQCKICEEEQASIDFIEHPDLCCNRFKTRQKLIIRTKDLKGYISDNLMKYKKKL